MSMLPLLEKRRNLEKRGYRDSAIVAVFGSFM